MSEEEKDKLIKEIAKSVIGIDNLTKLEIQTYIDGTRYIYFESFFKQYKIILQEDNQEISNI